MRHERVISAIRPTPRPPPPSPCIGLSFSSFFFSSSFSFITRLLFPSVHHHHHHHHLYSHLAPRSLRPPSPTPPTLFLLSHPFCLPACVRARWLGAWASVSARLYAFYVYCGTRGRSDAPARRREERGRIGRGKKRTERDNESGGRRKAVRGETEREREKGFVANSSSERENWTGERERVEHGGAGRGRRGWVGSGRFARCGCCGPREGQRGAGRSGVYNSCPGRPALRRPISSIKLQLGPEAEDVCM